MSDFKYVGKPFPIDDAALKVTGQVKYVDDMKIPGMLYAKVLFSPLAHAKIKSIDTSEAMALPGVWAVATHENSPRTRYNSTTRFYLQKPIENECIFTDIVRFIGDRVAAVAADTPEIAAKAIKLIKVEYEPLPHYTNPEQAMAKDAYPIHGDSNVVATVVQNAGDVEKGFAESDRVFTDRYTTPAVHHGAIECHTAIASFDASGKLTLISPFQNTFGQRIVLSRIFSLPLSKIRVISPTLGGAFGGKLEASLEFVPAVLSWLCGRPVKLTYNRKESMLSTRTRHASIVEIKTGVKNDGTITAQEFRVITNTGGYAGSAMNVIGAMSHKVFKAHLTTNMRFTGIPVYTNTPTAGAMRGYGSPQAYFAQQCQMYKIAKDLGIDYLDFQMKNLVDPDGVDQRYNTPIGNPHPKDCLKRALELSQNWPALSDENGKYKIGTGMALGVHCSSAYGAHMDQTAIIIKMNDDGSCVMYTGTHEMGQGALTIQKQSLAEILDIPLDKIAVVAGDTDACPWNLGDFSSRGAYVSVHAVKKTAEEVRERVLTEAYCLMGEDKADLKMENSGVRSSKTGAWVSLEEVMDYNQNKTREDIICARTYPAVETPGSYGIHAVRVRIEVETERVEVTDYVAVHDVGQVMNRSLIEGQLEGAIQMGLGYALSEIMEFDENGKTKNSNFRNYHMFTATQMPNIQTDFIEQGEPSGPFGAKSVSECAVVACAPALINALSDALGIYIYDLPYNKGRSVK